MYSPIKDGIDKSASFVRYIQAEPPDSLRKFVHCYWELKTDKSLQQDFHYQVVPDACVNILLNQRSLNIVAVTLAPASAMALNLGKDFRYVGIQLIPGVWRGDQGDLSRKKVDSPYEGKLPLVAYNQRITPLAFDQALPELTALVEELIRDGKIAENRITATILENIADIHKVSDMARLTGLSTRQLQRNLKAITGFSPHDFLKILRMQYAFGGDFLTHYADQAHYIHSFRRATGHTPLIYRKRFDV